LSASSGRKNVHSNGLVKQGGEYTPCVRKLEKPRQGVDVATITIEETKKKKNGLTAANTRLKLQP